MRAGPKPTVKGTFMCCDIRGFQYRDPRVEQPARGHHWGRCLWFLSGLTRKRGPAASEEVLCAPRSTFAVSVPTVTISTEREQPAGAV